MDKNTFNKSVHVWILIKWNLLASPSSIASRDR